MTATPRPERLIVIVDDDPDDVEFARSALATAAPGARIEVVGDGLELLALLDRSVDARRLPDLVLLDLRMPRMDGLEALRRIRAIPTLRRLPVVTMFTTASDEDLVVASYEAGANSYVTKPSSYTDLVRIMGDIVHHWFEVATLPRADAPRPGPPRADALD